MQTNINIKTEYREYSIIKNKYKKMLLSLKNKKHTFAIQSDYKTELESLKKETKSVLNDVRKTNKQYKKEVKKYLFIKDVAARIKLKKEHANKINKIKELKKEYKQKIKNQNIADILKLKKEYKEKISNISKRYTQEKLLVKPQSLKQFFILVKLNLKNYLGQTLLGSSFIRYLIFYIVALLLLTGFFYYFFVSFKFVTGINIGYQRSFIKVVLFLFFIGSTLTAGMTLNNNLYQNKSDNIILHLPLSSKSIYYSKILSSYIIELRRSFILYFSLLLGFGFFTQIVTFVYVLKLLFLVIILPIFSILIGQLIAIAILYIKYILRKYLFLNIFLALLIILLSVALIDYGIKTMTDDTGEILLLKLFISMHTLFDEGFSKLIRYSYLIKLSMNYLFNFAGFLKALVYFVKIVAYLILFVFITHINTYLYSFIKNFHLTKDLKNTNKMKKRSKEGNIFFEYVLKEFKMITRDPKLLTQTLLYAIMMPIIFYALNSFFKTLTLTVVGRQIVFFSQLIIGLIFLLTNNILISSIISREGESLYILKTNPRNVIVNIVAKLSILYINTLSVIIVSLLLNIGIGQAGSFETVLMHIVFLFASLIHSLWVSENDIVSPKNDDYKQSGVLENNLNVLKGIKIGIMLSVVILLLLYFIDLKITNIAISLSIIISILVLGFIIKCFTLKIKTNAYLRWNS